MLEITVRRYAIAQNGTQAILHRFTILGVAVRRCARRSVEHDRPQAIDHLSGLLKPSHMRATNCEPSVTRHRVRRFLQGTEQHRPSLLKLSAKNMTDTDPQERCGDRITRAEAQRNLEMLNRQVGFPTPQPEPAAAKPPEGKAWVELPGAVDQGDGGIDVLVKICEGVGSAT